MTAPTATYYIIAGEASGDMLGGELMEAMRRLSPLPITFHGVGGEQMISQGLHSLFPMQEISLMGFAEILPHIAHLKKRIAQTAADIIAKQPSIVITIDSPGFVNRVIHTVRKAGFKPVFIHYVAPTVWAYKPGRAEKLAKRVDHLLTLLPFEPPYFTIHGLKTHFVGHPAVWRWRERGNRARFLGKFGLDSNKLFIGVMPGSRKNEVRTHLPIFREALTQLARQHADMVCLIATTPSMRPIIEAMIQNDWPSNYRIVDQEMDRMDAFRTMNIALAKSGTVALETALAGIPTITAYKAHPFSAWLIGRMIKTPFVNLVNILLGREIIPEFIQQRCTPELLFSALGTLIHNPQQRDMQLQAFKQAAALLMPGDESPSDKAARIILSYQPASIASAAIS